MYYRYSAGFWAQNFARLNIFDSLKNYEKDVEKYKFYAILFFVKILKYIVEDHWSLCSLKQWDDEKMRSEKTARNYHSENRTPTCADTTVQNSSFCPN